MKNRYRLPGEVYERRWEQQEITSAELKKMMEEAQRDKSDNAMVVNGEEVLGLQEIEK